MKRARDTLKVSDRLVALPSHHETVEEGNTLLSRLAELLLTCGSPQAFCSYLRLHKDTSGSFGAKATPPPWLAPMPGPRSSSQSCKSCALHQSAGRASGRQLRRSPQAREKHRQSTRARAGQDLLVSGAALPRCFNEALWRNLTTRACLQCYSVCRLAFALPARSELAGSRRALQIRRLAAVTAKLVQDLLFMPSRYARPRSGWMLLRCFFVYCGALLRCQRIQEAFDVEASQQFILVERPSDPVVSRYKLHLPVSRSAYKFKAFKPPL